MAVQAEQQRVLDNDLVEERVKQIALNHFFSYYIRHDMDDVKANLDEEMQWVGSKECFIARSKDEYIRLLEQELGTVSSDCKLNVIRAEAMTLGNDFYSTSGELELRMPVKEKIKYVILRYSMTLMHRYGRYFIKSIHTSLTGESHVVPGRQGYAQNKSLYYPAEQKQLSCDPLTGFLNLDAFKRVTRELLKKEGTRHKFALLCTDVSHFEKVNNVYGLKQADKVLTDLALMITSCSQSVKVCCRSVADHFLVLIAYKDVSSLRMTLKKLCDGFTQKISRQYRDALPKLGIGVYLVTDPKGNIGRMVEWANAARKSLRFQKGNRIAFYDAKVFEQMEKVRKIEASMRDAMKNGEFKVYFQPKYDLDSGTIVGAEALCRWIHPDGSMEYPDEFIPIFERNGFIVELDFFMLETVCKMIRRRLKRGHPCVSVSINQSRVLLKDKDYVTKISGIAHMMERLKKLGIRWSIDDFGTGYSSLNLLKELPVDIIKLDKSFLDETENSEKSKIIIRKIVELTQELEKKVVCEGVETVSQADYLQNIRCDIAQGYLYARPMPMNEFEKLLDKEIDL